jgi:hypothetical protein
MARGDKRGRPPLVAPAKLPIPTEVRRRATELALWWKQERQQRERGDWRRTQATEPDAH